MIKFIFLFIFAFTSLVFAKDENKHKGNPGGALNPGIIYESFADGKNQVLVSNCFYQVKSNAYNVDFKFFDCGVGARFADGYSAETIGKLAPMTGNYWIQNTESDSAVASDVQYKCGVDLAEVNGAGLFTADVKIIGFNAEFYYNPSVAGINYKTPNKYVIPGFWAGLCLQPSYTLIQKFPNMFTDKDSSSINGFSMQSCVKLGLNLKNNYLLSDESSYRIITGPGNFKEFKSKIKFSKEFYYNYTDIDFGTYESHSTKALEIFAYVNYNYTEFDKFKYNGVSLGLGLSFYNYMEYVNVWEVLKNMN